jgi:hypothetical protein
MYLSQKEMPDGQCGQQIKSSTGDPGGLNSEHRAINPMVIRRPRRTLGERSDENYVNLTLERTRVGVRQYQRRTDGDDCAGLFGGRW